MVPWGWVSIRHSHPALSGKSVRNAQGLGQRPREGQHYLNESQQGQGLRGDTNAWVSRDHNQQARETQSPWRQAGELLWACDLPGTHSSNFPSRICSKEKGRNLKPVPL